VNLIFEPMRSKEQSAVATLNSPVAPAAAADLISDWVGGMTVASIAATVSVFDDFLTHWRHPLNAQHGQIAQGSVVWGSESCVNRISIWPLSRRNSV
jgi:hypothetical protein